MSVIEKDPFFEGISRALHRLKCPDTRETHARIMARDFRDIAEWLEAGKYDRQPAKLTEPRR